MIITRHSAAFFLITTHTPVGEWCINTNTYIWRASQNTHTKNKKQKTDCSSSEKGQHFEVEPTIEFIVVCTDVR